MSPVIEVLECTDVTGDFDPASLSPGERVFKAKYIDQLGRVVVRHISYSPSRGLSSMPDARALQEACIKLLGLSSEI